MLMQARMFPSIWLAVPAVLLLRLVCVLHGSRRGISRFRERALFLFFVYIIFVASITLNWSRILHLDFAAGATYNLHLLRGIAGILEAENPVYIFANIAGNVLLFAPLGFFSPLLWRRQWLLPTMLTGVLSSAAIECIQYVTGRRADVDDVLLNTAGALVGFILYACLRAARPDIVRKCRGDREKPPPRDAAARERGQIREDKRGPRRLAAALTLCGILGSVCFFYGAGASAQDTPAAPAWEGDAAETKVLAGGSLHSKAALLLSLSDDRTLLDYYGDARIYPASMTKIMTVLVAIEHLPDIDATIELRDEIFEITASENAATAGFLPGERVKAVDLLYGAMLPSGAECSLGLAEHIAGSEEGFVRLMNRKAAELGMEGARFTNATGLHDPEHYATARDIALLLGNALGNRLFAEIFTSARHSTSATNLHPDGITFVSTLFSRMDRDEIPGVSILGGKTGYTHEAGQCLASLAEIGGRRYILVTAGAYPEDAPVQALHMDDARAIYAVV